MDRYLYGSSVQQIQPFIFETGKLKEIIGASEMVEQICTTRFEQAAGEIYKESSRIVGAAGKITYLFDSRDECERVVYDFHKKIMEEIPGINLVQAVVKVDEHLTEDHFKQLEERLDIQKNKVVSQHGIGLMISERSRRTGGPATKVEQLGDEPEYLDRKQVVKRKYGENAKGSLFEKIIGENNIYDPKQYPLEIGQLLADGERGWIAIVHADGNSLGKTIQKITKQVGANNPGHLQEMLKAFSKSLEDATRKAAAGAFEKIVKPVVDEEQKYIPLRPVLLGGDDLTLIIRGELAIDFTEEFLKGFALHTKNCFAPLVEKFDLADELKEGLSACAGIAYIKPNYPFHYGVSLSDSLCSYAKKAAKGINGEQIPSCVAFHRVQSSFVENYYTIIQRELTTGEGREAVYFNYGPYFLDEPISFEYASIDQLKNWVKNIKKEDAPKAPLRNWLTELNLSRPSADQLMERIKNLNKKYIKKLGLDKAIVIRNLGGDNTAVTHLNDVITLASIEK